MKNPIIPALFFIFVLGLACRQKETIPQFQPDDLVGGAVSTVGTRFIDSHGREVILNGLNKVNKNRDQNYTDPDSMEVFSQFTRWGFNCVRLGIIWDGIEPEPGKYDENYLDKVAKRVEWATQNGLYVLLDMHQDLYSVSFSDGAPPWATITENKPHVKSAIWSDSYIISPAVHKAFDHFWANTPASDGIGIQDHYAMMWKHVVKRFAGNKAVIGYDIMNEPFNGTPGTQILPVVLKEFARLYAEETGKVLSENEVLGMWSDENLRPETLSRLNEPQKYSRVFDAAKELNQEFERSVLQPMYQKVCNAIREEDTTHILFLEHGYFCNAGIPSAIEPVRDRNGNPDPLVCYAAHAYDLLVDTKNYDSQNNTRVELLFSRIHETSQKIHVPVLVGEWGAFYGGSEALDSSAQFITGLFSRFGFGNTYWSYYPGMEKDLYFTSALIRPYPPYIGGRLQAYGFNHKTGLFSCSWMESRRIRKPTVIFIPDLDNLIRESIILTPESKKPVIYTVPDSKAGYLIIPVQGDSVTRNIEFRLVRKPYSSKK